MRLACWLAVAAAAGCAARDTSDPCPGAARTKGPWVMRAGDTHASVFWESQSQGCVQLALSGYAWRAVIDDRTVDADQRDIGEGVKTGGAHLRVQTPSPMSR